MAELPKNGYSGGSAFFFEEGKEVPP